MSSHERPSDGPSPAIRPERAEDAPVIRALHDDAFGGLVEGALVDALRGTDDWIDGGSLVAVDAADAIVGHVLLSTGSLTGDDGSVRPMWMLGPIGVRPDRQGQGIGGALMRAAIELAIGRRQPVVCLVGHPTYYPRFGFEPARALGILPPDAAWSDAHWMVLRLPGWTPRIRGRARYASAFPT